MIQWQCQHPEKCKNKSIQRTNPRAGSFLGEGDLEFALEGPLDGAGVLRTSCLVIVALNMELWLKDMVLTS